MWIDRRGVDGKVSGLKRYYYILNNLIRHTTNPKDGAALDLNGYVRNVLARFASRGDRFNVPRFLWHECGGYTPGYHKMVHVPHHLRWPGP